MTRGRRGGRGEVSEGNAASLRPKKRGGEGLSEGIRRVEVVARLDRRTLKPQGIGKKKDA